MKNKGKNFLSSAADAYNSYKPKAQSKFSQVINPEQLAAMTKLANETRDKKYTPPLTSYINPAQKARITNDTTNKNYNTAFDKNMADEYRKAMISSINMMDSTKQKKHGGSIKKKK